MPGYYTAIRMYDILWMEYERPTIGLPYIYPNIYLRTAYPGKVGISYFNIFNKY